MFDTQTDNIAEFPGSPTNGPPHLGFDPWPHQGF